MWLEYHGVVLQFLCELNQSTAGVDRRVVEVKLVNWSLSC